MKTAWSSFKRRAKDLDHDHQFKVCARRDDEYIWERYRLELRFSQIRLVCFSGDFIGQIWQRAVPEEQRAGVRQAGSGSGCPLPKSVKKSAASLSVLRPTLRKMDAKAHDAISIEVATCYQQRALG